MANEPYDKEGGGKDFFAESQEKKQAAKAQQEAEKTQASDEGVDNFYNNVNATSSSESQSFFSGDAAIGKRTKKMAGSPIARAAKRRRNAIIGGVVGTMVGSGISFLIGVLPFELPYISNVLRMEIGGVSSNVLQLRSGRLYSRMFFFDEDGEFSGFKEKPGVFKILTGRNPNVYSQELVRMFEAEGLEVIPHKNAAGKPTGRFESIELPNGEKIVDEKSFADAWNNRKVLRRFMQERFKSESWFYRSKWTRHFYHRWNTGRLRGQWWQNRVADKIDSSLHRMKAKLIGAQLDTDGYTKPTLMGGQYTEDVDGTQTSSNIDTDGLEESADARRAEVADLSTIDESKRTLDVQTEHNLHNGPENLLGNFKVSDIDLKGATLRAVSLLGSVDAGCQILRLFITAESASRILKANSLMTYATLFLSMADVAYTGKVDQQDYAAFTSFLKQRNPVTGVDFYGSGAWQYARRVPGATVNSVYTNKYNVGGGWTGRLQHLRTTTLNSFLGITGGNPEQTAEGICGFVNNPVVQIVSFAGGLIAAGLSFGATVVKGVAGLAVEAAKVLAEAILMPMIIDMIAGTIITGDEFGDEMAAALISGYGATLTGLGSSFGMKPTTKTELSILEAEAEKDRRDNLAQMSIFERYFSPDNYRSLTASTLMAMPRSFSTLIHTFANITHNPLSYLLGSFSNMPFSNAYAASTSYSDQCNAKDIVDNNLAADPFCNLIFGENIQTLSLDPIENFNALMEMDDPALDPDGKPLSADYIDWLGKCVGMLDIIHEKKEFSNAFTDECYVSNEKVAADGTVTIMSEEEMIARENTIFTFDDLYAYDATRAGAQQYAGSDSGNKAFAQSGGTGLDGWVPSKVDRYRAAVLDTALLLAMEEEDSQQFYKGGSLDGGFDEGFAPNDYFRALSYKPEAKPKMGEREKYTAINNNPTVGAVSVCASQRNSFTTPLVCDDIYQTNTHSLQNVPLVTKEIRAIGLTTRITVNKEVFV